MSVHVRRLECLFPVHKSLKFRESFSQSVIYRSGASLFRSFHCSPTLLHQNEQYEVRVPLLQKCLQCPTHHPSLPRTFFTHSSRHYTLSFPIPNLEGPVRKHLVNSGPASLAPADILRALPSGKWLRQRWSSERFFMAMLTEAPCDQSV